MNRLRVGVVGVGHLGRHHARVLSGIEGVELVGVVDARPDQARAVAEPLGTQAWTDYQELFDRVDAVSVAVPTIAHRRVAGAFLERGIPVLVEKPIAPSVEEAEELVALAEAKGVVLQVGHIERFNPIYAALTEARVRPRYIAAERLGIYTFRSTDIGVVLDLMIHDLDLILSMIPSPVRSVSALGVSIFGVHEDIANARIEFKDGCVVDLSASRASYHASRKMRLWGAEGYLTVDFAAKHATIVRPSDRLRRGDLDLEGLDLSQPSAIRDHLFGKVFRVDQVQPDGREPLALEIEDFIRAVRHQQKPRVSGEDGLRALRVADQVLKSLANHRWDGHAEGPTGPIDLPTPLAEPIAGLAGPKLWKTKPTQRAGTPQGSGES